MGRLSTNIGQHKIERLHDILHNLHCLQTFYTSLRIILYLVLKHGSFVWWYRVKQDRTSPRRFTRFPWSERHFTLSHVSFYSAYRKITLGIISKSSKLLSKYYNKCHSYTPSYKKFTNCNYFISITKPPYSPPQCHNCTPSKFMNSFFFNFPPELKQPMRIERTLHHPVSSCSWRNKEYNRSN